MIAVKHKTVFLFLAALCLSLYALAQDQNWKSNSWQYGVGSTYIYDDYISPVSYNSPSVRLVNEKIMPLGRLLPDDKYDWYNICNFTLIPSIDKSVSGAYLYSIQAEFKNTVLHKFGENKFCNLYAGGLISLKGGGRLVQQTRNNPGSADIMTDLGVAFAADRRFKLFGKELFARYLLNIPLIGLTFSPEYTQTYYEIFYLGNYAETIRFTHPFNKQQWMQQLSLDVPLYGKRSGLRFSYWNEGRISRLNDLNIRILSDHFSVGYIKYFRVL